MFKPDHQQRIVDWIKQQPADAREQFLFAEFARSNNELKNAFRDCFQLAKGIHPSQRKAAESGDVPSGAQTPAAAQPAGSAES